MLGIFDLTRITELRSGTIAHEIIHGLTLPLTQYHEAHQGGMLIYAFIIVPFFLAFGENIITLKFVWLLMSVLIFCLFYYLVRKNWSEKIATVAALLFVLAPPFFVHWNISEEATYLWGMLFTLLIMACFFHVATSNRQYLLRFAIFGGICGFAVFFEYSSSIMTLAALLFLLLLQRRLFLKGLLVFILFYAIGLIPWITYNFTHNLRGIAAYARPIYQIGAEGPNFWGNLALFSRKLTSLLTMQLPQSFQFTALNASFGGTLDYIYYLTFIASLIYVAFRHRKAIITLIKPHSSAQLASFNLSKKNVFLILYFLFYALILSANYIDIGDRGNPSYRYLLNLYPIIFITIAIALVQMGEKISYLKLLSSKRIMFVTSAFILCGCVFSVLQAYHKNRSRPIFIQHVQKPFDIHWITERAARYHKADMKKVDEVCRNRDDKFRVHCYKDMLWYGVQLHRPDSFEQILTEIYKIPEKYRFYSFEWACYLAGLVLDETPEYLITYGKKFPPEVRATYYKEIAIAILNRNISEKKGSLNQTLRLPALVPEQDQKWWFSGIGFYSGENRLHKTDPDLMQKFIQQVPRDELAYFYRGYGEGIAYRSGVTILTNHEIAAIAPREYSREFYQGIGEGIMRNYDNSPGLYAGTHPSLILDSLAPHIRENLREGITVRHRKVYQKDPKETLFIYLGNSGK